MEGGYRTTLQPTPSWCLSASFSEITASANALGTSCVPGSVLSTLWHGVFECSWTGISITCISQMEKLMLEEVILSRLYCWKEGEQRYCLPFPNSQIAILWTCTLLGTTIPPPSPSGLAFQLLFPISGVLHFNVGTQMTLSDWSWSLCSEILSETSTLYFVYPCGLP